MVVDGVDGIVQELGDFGTVVDAQPYEGEDANVGGQGVGVLDDSALRVSAWH